MRKLVTVVTLVCAANAANADEFRGVLGYSIGSTTFEDDVGDELSGDISQRVLSGTYYSNQAGPFIGLRLGQAEVGDLEFNGIPLGVPDQKSDDVAFTLGYRGGSFGEPQLFASVTLGRTDYDDGDDENSSSFAVGVEKSTQGGRYEVSAGYSSGDEIDSYSLAVAGIVYVSERVGFGAVAGYSLGDGTILGVDVDVSGWSLGVGVEFRLLR